MNKWWRPVSTSYFFVFPEVPSNKTALRSILKDLSDEITNCLLFHRGIYLF